MLFPKVRLKGIEAPEPKLLWHKVKRGDQDGGEILAECELFLVRSSSLKRSVFRLFVNVHRKTVKLTGKKKKKIHKGLIEHALYQARLSSFFFRRFLFKSRVENI